MVNKLKKVPGLLWVSFVIIIIFILFVPNFSQAQNYNNILKNASILAIASVGMTMSILAGEIDMSIGGVMSASAMMAALYLKAHETLTVGNILVGILIAVAVGFVFGLINGILIAKFKFNFWLVTFGTMSIAYGLSEMVTNGYIISGFPSTFRKLADGSVLGISSVIFIAAAVLVIMCFVLYRTRLGMHIYAFGDSEQCARQSGINVDKEKTILYIISGVISGFAGILLISKTNSCAPSVANGYEFDAIAAVIIGGTPFVGGKGGLAGTIVGVIVIHAIKVGLLCMGLTTNWQQTVIGFFILAIIIVDVISTHRKEIKQLRREYRDA